MDTKDGLGSHQILGNLTSILKNLGCEKSTKRLAKPFGINQSHVTSWLYRSLQCLGSLQLLTASGCIHRAVAFALSFNKFILLVFTAKQ